MIKFPCIAISSCAFAGKTLRQIDSLAQKHRFIVEYSSGLRYEPDLERKFLTARCSRLIHNYFPAPRIPFVLNLASLDRSTWNRSIKHAQKGLQLARRSGSPFYSVHAGFCFDPSPNELGRPLAHYQRQKPRRQYWNRFVRAIRILAKEAEHQQVDLLVENNVVSLINRDVPLLCSDSIEMNRLCEEVSHARLGLLLDTGHLKVSAQTLRFSLSACLNKITPRIRGIHHSDNDGTQDSNQSLAPGYWFLPLMPQFPFVIHVIEVCNLTVAQAKQQAALLRKAIQQPILRGQAC